MKGIKQFILSISILCLVFSCAPKMDTWDVRNFGAVGDSLSLNTVAIQSAIDDCHTAGGGTVSIQDGIYISGTVLLKDNVTLYIDESAKLQGSSNPMDYTTIDPFTDATGQLRGKCLLGADGAKNIGLSGKGTIDGLGKQFLRENLLKTMNLLGINKSEIGKYSTNRPFLVRFVKSSNITVTDIHLRQPAAWTLHFFQCNNFNVDGIEIYSHAHKNNDGIDIDSSSDGIILNCNIDAGDDAICFKTTSPVPTQNIKVNNCRLKSDWGTIKFGTESMGDFSDITIKNCFIHDTRGGGIKILSVDGANISNILIDSIQMENVDMPIFMRLGERLRTYRDAPKQAVGSIKNVTIKNIKAIARDLENSRVSPPSGIFLTGTKNHRIMDVHLENIKITLPGGGLAEHSDRDIAEDENRYPEFSFFGISPASGLYARHLDQLSVKNLDITFEKPDARQLFVKEDVIKSEINLNTKK